MGWDQHWWCFHCFPVQHNWARGFSTIPNQASRWLHRLAPRIWSQEENHYTEMDQKITIKLPISLHEIFREVRGQDFRQSQMATKQLQGKLTFAGDKLRVESETVKGFFRETCGKIVDHLREIFDQPAVSGVNTILMVGGFSESPHATSCYWTSVQGQESYFTERGQLVGAERSRHLRSYAAHNNSTGLQVYLWCKNVPQVQVWSRPGKQTTDCGSTGLLRRCFQ